MPLAEALAAERGVDRVIAEFPAIRRLALVLDCQPVVDVLGGGAPHSLRLARMAYRLQRRACRHRLSVRVGWVSTHHQPADGPSRGLRVPEWISLPVVTWSRAVFDIGDVVWSPALPATADVFRTQH
jgi:hypothetical protein